MIQHFTGDMRARLAEHQAGHSARRLQVATAAGITRTWRGDRKRERQLQNQGGASRRCPKAASGSASHQPSERNKQP